MFDPTAFDNMKVVLEGAIYDRDLRGELVITDRNDVMNMAKMSRSFDIVFQLPDKMVSGIMKLESKLHNLTAELLSSSATNQLAGCYVELKFIIKTSSEVDYQKVKHILLGIWGETRKIELSSISYPLEANKTKSTVLTVDFDRLVTEDQMDDLVEMTEFMMTSLEQLSRL
ncbi:hypothetical protein [Neobacillus jeddahensis]|uniref:hypothetical protein n=1 Tax=Neobacillus jeddahensis TaxID=1461580 RepID=UPI00058C9C95|nr:hypothetical protein [Neobacillus jeddahensis]